MRKTALAALVLVVLAPAAAGADDIKDRGAAMRSNDTARRALLDMLAAGEFDAAAVKKNGQILIDNSGKIKVAFAPGTDTTDPQSDPAIWNDAAGFAVAADRLGTVAAGVAAATDAPSLQAALTAVSAACAGCHRKYEK